MVQEGSLKLKVHASVINPLTLNLLVDILDNCHISSTRFYPFVTNPGWLVVDF